MQNILIFALPLLLFLAAPAALADDELSAHPPIKPVYTSIYWSDGDSGRLGDLKFRLANVDAPETGSQKQRGGAKCERERARGYNAKAFLVEITKGKTVAIVRDYGEDRYGRLVVDLDVSGFDPAQAAIEAGHLASWPHRKGRKLAPKPDWCLN